MKIKSIKKPLSFKQWFSEEKFVLAPTANIRMTWGAYFWNMRTEACVIAKEAWQAARKCFAHEKQFKTLSQKVTELNNLAGTTALNLGHLSTKNLQLRMKNIAMLTNDISESYGKLTRKLVRKEQ